MNNTLIPIINIILGIGATAIGIRTYMIMRSGALGNTWLFFILGSLSFIVMQGAATIMRTDEVMGMNGEPSTLGLVHDLAGIGIILFFLIGSFSQYRALTVMPEFNEG